LARLIERIEEYDSWTSEEEKFTLRERLANGFVYPGPAAKPRSERLVSSVKIRLTDGEWVEL